MSTHSSEPMKLQGMFKCNFFTHERVSRVVGWWELRTESVNSEGD
jgi:hypothetical protein